MSNIVVAVQSPEILFNSHTDLKTLNSGITLEVCQKVRLGQLTKTAACREHALAPSLLDRWLERYDQDGQAAFQEAKPPDLERRVKELEASLGRVHLENEFLREALGKLGIPVKRQP